jgi:mono/diheme cytochrome c family protein
MNDSPQPRIKTSLRGSARLLTPPATILLASLGLADSMIALAQPSSAYVPTYYVDVKPILERHCASCHTAGGIAPFALDNPKDAVTWAARIAEVTKSEYMPPWPPGRDSQPFLNERRLGAASKQMLEAWAKAGAPLGTTPKTGPKK